MRRLVMPLASAALAVAAIAAPASASITTSKVVRFGSCRSSGDYAICTASGTVHHPYSIYLHVTSSPDQKVSGAWDMTCAKGTSAASKSGSFTKTTPVRMRLPMPFSYPSYCIVAGDAQLLGDGSIHVYLTAHVPS